MLGEVGLDRSMRVPFPSTSDGGSRSLSPFKVPIEHQIHILEAQIRLAVKLKRHISFHSVNAQQITGSLFDRMSQELKGDWLRISIDMHSCGLSAETWGALEVWIPISNHRHG
jgi:Tat protein secretion system quality control protein TatD with DNase activity